MILADKIIDLRKKNGWSQEELAEKLGGTVPLLSQIPTGCRFAPRCAYATERCRQETPQLTPVSDKQSVRCFRAAELAQKEATAQ